MNNTTSHLSITLLAQNQAQKEVTVNEAILAIDAILNTGAKAVNLNTPPPDPQKGDLYIIGQNPTSEWKNKAAHLAYFHDGWRFIKPNEGMQLWACDLDRFYVFDGQNWVIPAKYDLPVIAEITSNYQIDTEKSSIFELTLKNDCLIEFQPNSPRKLITLIIKQPPDGGKKLSWPKQIKWSGAVHPTISSQPNATLIAQLITTGGGNDWYGFIVAANS